ncbi:IclR family transcriptional regulator [Primorskyibacter aestuariivivens]|uniref:IclR family transcriptional regulator n=1 Tax=Primorskyibacter aestuariivivens TaxID=1888912 RepID=UPI002301E608|nr:IclR family transcriptional regulator [Primorskyibacter aestuariivivens]MDA7430905.1 IclR family transcriptional regulator [Primorskyibacter aestuariivivens]
MAESRKTVGVFDKALNVLSCFSADMPDLTIEEISQVTKINRSSVQRVVFTLNAMGYLEFEEQGRAYRISQKLLGLSFSYLKNSQLLRMGMPVLVRLANTSNLRADLVVLDGNEVVYLARIPSRAEAFSVSPAGRRWTAVSSAYGRAILSTMPDEQCERILQSSKIPTPTSRTITDMDVIRSKIRQASSDGFAFQLGEVIEGSAAIGAPVFSPSGKAIAAVGLGTTVGEMEAPENRSLLSKMAMETALTLSRMNISV